MSIAIQPNRLVDAPEANVLPPVEAVDEIAPAALPAFVAQLAALLARAAARMCLCPRTVDCQVSPSTREECYLSVRQLATRVPYAEHTIRNLMAANVFRENEHYFKRSGRIMFSWSAVRTWVENTSRSASDQVPLTRSRRRAR